jgi:hypothetical protein
MFATYSGPLTTTGSTTSLSIGSLIVGESELYPIQSVVLSITNPTSSGQTITSGNLVFSQTVGGVTSTITYALTLSIAAGANEEVFVALTNGVIPGATLQVTFGSNPSAGTLTCLAVWNETIGSGSGGGGGAVTIADGADVALGTTTQAKATDATTTSWSVIQLLKGIFNSLLTFIGVGGVYNSSQPTFTNGQFGQFQMDANGNQIVDTMKLDSTNDAIQIGQTGTIVSVKAASTPAAATDPAFVVAMSPNSPVTPYVVQASANSNNATNVKASAGTLYGVQAFSLAAYPVFIKLYNKASTPTPGTDTVVKSIMIPANAAPSNGAGLVLAWPQGIAFGTGLSFSIVKGQGNSDNTSVAAGDCSLNLDYA